MKRHECAVGALAAKCCLVGLMFLIAACQQEVIAEGTLDDTERVTATATGVPGVSGEVTVTGKDLQCTGPWKYVLKTGAVGLLQCADGQRGAFFFGIKGNGVGLIGTRKFNFTFTPIWKG